MVPRVRRAIGKLSLAAATRRCARESARTPEGPGCRFPLTKFGHKVKLDKLARVLVERNASEMKVTNAVFVLLVGGFVLAPTASAVVDTRGVDEVIKKSVLTPQDLAVIDAFVLDAVEEIIRTDDFTQIATARTTLLSRQNPQQAQYAQQFSESTAKHIPAALQEAQGVADPVRRFRVMTNLLILVDGLKDPRLVDIAVRAISQDNNSVRYWAVRAATDPGLWAKLGQNQAASTQLAERIMAECTRVVQDSSSEVINLMADFAGRFNTPAAETLLLRAADERIKRYGAWNPGYELADGALLKLLSNKLTASGTPNPEVAKRFAQLYSFVIQRYIKGQQRNVLTSASRSYLMSVIAEVEDKCLNKLLGVRQPTLTRAVQEANLDTLQAEHDKLLGGTGQTGALVSKLNINYGTTGNSRPTPLPLPDPPALATPASAPAIAQPPAKPALAPKPPTNLPPAGAPPAPKP